MCRLVTPLGLARTVTEDDEYRGYSIPKGTTILPNVWCAPIFIAVDCSFKHTSLPFLRAVLHESSRYPDPLRFNPDRYTDEQRNKELGINELPLAAFGFGRRYVSSYTSTTAPIAAAPMTTADRPYVYPGYVLGDGWPSRPFGLPWRRR